MKTFKEWLTKAHPEVLDEDWRKWARNAALAGTIGAAGLGLMPGQSKAADAPVNKSSNSSISFIQRLKADNARMKQQADQLRKAGMKQGTFVQGKLQVPNIEDGSDDDLKWNGKSWSWTSPNWSKYLGDEDGKSWTAPNAGDYLK